jgi:hypothetical protein
MVVYIKYGIGHNIAAFQIKYGPHKQSPRKRSEAHGNENNLLEQTFFLEKCHTLTCLLCHMFKLYFKLLLVT